MATTFKPTFKADLTHPAMAGLTLSKSRRPEAKRFELPSGLHIVSADNHIGLKDDIWFEGFPEHLKAKAPRVVHDSGLWAIRFPGGPTYDEMTTQEKQFFRIFESNDIPGNTDLDARMGDLEVEGYQQEIAFPQMLGMFFALPDLEVREWIFRLYNHHLAKMQALKPGKFYGVAIPNYWDMNKARNSILEIKALGLKTYMVPRFPGKDKDGHELFYSSPDYKPFWDAVEEAGLPINFHIGEGAIAGGVNGWATMVLESLDAFRRTFAQLVFGGIFDRHPSLQVVFVESGINWVPSALQDAEMMYDSFTDMFEPLPRLRPSEYWRKHCYAVFVVDPIGLKMLDYVGADRVMWSADYPHNEGSYGFNWQSMRDVLDHVSESDARLILGDTARRLYGLA